MINASSGAPAPWSSHKPRRRAPALPAAQAETYTAHSGAIPALQFNSAYPTPCSSVPAISIGATSNKRYSLASDLTLLHGPSQDQMRPRISLITLGVSDLERAVAFYRDGLGLATQGIMGTEFEIGAVAFFELESGLKLALWPCSSLAADTGLPARPPSPTAFSLAHNVGSTSEVDEVMEQARKAGAKVVKRAQPAFWGGYAGYFQDPDGHLWEVVFNPDMASTS